MKHVMDKTNIAFETVPAPRPKTGADHQKEYAKRNPDKVSESNKRYRDINADRVKEWGAQWRKSNPGRKNGEYLSKPFAAWDGEGITLPNGKHVYNLFAAKCGDDTVSISDNEGLSSYRIFETLLTFKERNPSAIHVIYGGSYDFNMWCADIPKDTVDYLYRNKFARWRNYRLSWRRGKSFYVCRLDDDGNKIGSGITVYDIVSFFQSSFVAACDSYLGERFLHRDMIVAQKAARGTFQDTDLDTVTDYNDAELDNLIMLANELRARLNKVGLRPRRWDSCGAIAAALMEQHGIKAIARNAATPEPVLEASRYAYAGGRFEVIRYGHVDHDVYEYDINSAYPSALQHVPDISNGEWEHVEGDPGFHPFAMYHIESFTRNMDIPAPLFRRGSNGTVSYPQATTGWYWSPEYSVWNEYVRRGLSKGKVLGAWIFHPHTDRKPFSFIEPLYMKRRALKKAGDGAHVGIKLGLNSLYGKLAQQVGAEQREDGSWRLPPYHCLEWAGYATSHCRATILGAVIDRLDTVIAFETDAVFVTEPLDVSIGSNLGEFGEDRFLNMTYVQSGMYFADHANGSVVEKTRGIDRGELHREDVLEHMFKKKADDRTAKARLTRFVGAGIALMGRWDKWRSWETMTKNLTLEPTGKRVHLECQYCSPGVGPGYLHHTMCPIMDFGHSEPFPIIWANPDPEMDMLEELRNRENDYGD